MKLCILGFGAVGRGVAKVISKKRDEMKDKYGLDIKITAVTDSLGAAICNEGLDPELLLEIKEKNGKVSSYPQYGINNISNMEVLDKANYDCLIEVTPTDIEDGEPAKTHILKAITDKKEVVTSNKGPLALSFKELATAAKENGVQLKYEASVGGAMPILNFAHDTLPSCNIESIFGILNGTTNYILSRMAKEGSTYEQILKESQEMGIAETNPAQDVEGTDAACKVVILANSIMGKDVNLKDVDVVGISKITQEAISLAKNEGYLIKLIGEVSDDALQVSPRLVREGSPFAVDGTLNVATLKTDLAEDVTVVGKGAGSIETASAILSDIISIYKTKK
ncbi:homoserine dehydrogenase [Methanobacterium oryzae]|uniref:homoserine dehydrogenase n=1 Tax=Methanobacterium oryzae TaxID=69540 RepID=UPI003D246563